MSFNPDLHNFDHHQTDDEICSLTMVLDHFYGPSYREYIPQLTYIEIYDSQGSSMAAKFAGVPPEALDISSSLIQQFVLKAFSRLDGEVKDPFYSIMKDVGREICTKIEDMGLMMDELDRYAKVVRFSGIDVLDVTGCSAKEPDQLPTKHWCKSRGISPSVILTKDSRREGSFRMVSVDKSAVKFPSDPRCQFVHASGFLASFDRLEDWENILAKALNQTSV